MPRTPVRRHSPAFAGVIVGVAGVWLAVVLGNTAVAQRSPSDTNAIFEANHLPPLLRLPDERPRLVYEVHCAPGGVEDPERRCNVAGNVFIRLESRGAFRALRLEPSSAEGIQQLEATMPIEVATSPDGFEYYAELRALGRTDSSFRRAEPPRRIGH